MEMFRMKLDSAGSCNETIRKQESVECLGNDSE